MRPIFRPVEILRPSTVRIGRKATTISVTMFGTLLLYAKAILLKQCPPGIVLSQVYAKGVHWKHVATMNDSHAAKMKPTSPQAILRSIFCVKTRR